MIKVDGFDLVIEYLKDKAVLTTNGKNRFALKKDKVVCVQDGSSYTIKMDDFKAIHHKDIFYIVEDNSSFIDLEKDEAYYRYYKK